MDLGSPLATVTSALDGDVLTVLATHDAAFTTGQIHRILGDFSEEGIRKVLARLKNQGVVMSDRIGRTFAYRLNVDHLAAGPIVQLARIRSTFLTSLEELLSAWAQPPLYAAVFGSVARGTMSADSDIDLLLVGDDEADDTLWSQQVADLSATVTQWTGNDARVVEFQRSDLPGLAREPVFRDVVDHGLTVAGERAWLLRQLKLAEKAGN
jgi:predicted nucleotidyltransferase